MNKEFIPYEQALELKELGFDERTLDAYYKTMNGDYTLLHFSDENEDDYLDYHYDRLPAPLYQQAFRWFREKHGFHHVIFPNLYEQTVWCIRWYVNGVQNYTPYIGSYTYEEAELACLKKLIEQLNKQP